MVSKYSAIKDLSTFDIMIEILIKTELKRRFKIKLFAGVLAEANSMILAYLKLVKLVV